MKRIMLLTLIFLMAALLAMALPVSAATTAGSIAINVVLNTGINQNILKDLGTKGRILDVLTELNALTMRVKADSLASIRALPYVSAANPDAVRNGAPIDAVDANDFTGGMSTWDLDAINVTDFGNGRIVDEDGTGVYVAVLDTGLVDSWRQYFPEERIAEEYAMCFGGGGGEVGTVSSQPNKWEHDQNSHGTHVTSTIIGYNYAGQPVNGVAPMATIIPVKVLNQNGSGWSSVVARGITYIADLKAGSLKDHPVVINMSLGGPELDAIEKAAIDYAVSVGVIIVASAGNEGKAGMGYPGAYQPVISVAASGWVNEWHPVTIDGVSTTRAWWYALDVTNPISAGNFYIADFSSRAISPEQDLDIAAPGSWVRGPYQTNSGQTSYYFLGGTSMASPHVAGIAALMAEKDPTLTADDVETILESTAVYLAPGSNDVSDPYGNVGPISWGADATGAGLVDAAAALGAIS